MRRTVTSHH